MTSTTAVHVRWLPLQVTPKTCWTFVEIEDREGRVGVGDETAVRRAGRQRVAAAGIRDGAGAGPSGTRRAARRERRATAGRVSL